MAKKLAPPGENEPIKIVTDKAGDEHYEVHIATKLPNGKRRYAKRHFDKISEARRFVREFKSDGENGRLPVKDTTTVWQLAEKWLASKSAPRPGTLDDYRVDLRRALRGHESVLVTDIDRTMLQTWVAEWPSTGSLRGGPVSPRTVQIGILRLRQICDHAVELGLLKNNVAKHIETPAITLDEENAVQERRTDATVWTFGQLKKFVEAVDEEEDLTLSVAYRLSAAGMRRSEVLGLDWTQIDLDRGLIHICQARRKDTVDRVKRKLSRGTIEIERMVPGTLQLLKELWLQHGRPATNKVRFDRDGLPYSAGRDHLVVLDAVGQPFDRDIFSRTFVRISDDAGLPRIVLHGCRHTVATQLHAQGATLAEGAALLRHSIETHQRNYVRVTDEHKVAAAKRYAAAWAAAE